MVNVLLSGSDTETRVQFKRSLFLFFASKCAISLSFYGALLHISALAIIVTIDSLQN